MIAKQFQITENEFGSITAHYSEYDSDGKQTALEEEVIPIESSEIWQHYKRATEIIGQTNADDSEEKMAGDRRANEIQRKLDGRREGETPLSESSIHTTDEGESRNDSEGIPRKE